MTVDEAFRLGRQHQEAGRLMEAWEVYRAILARAPANAECLHCLGIIACQLGREREGVELFCRALVCRPDFPHALANLGNILAARGEMDQAIVACRRAVALEPEWAEAHGNLGNALLAKGDLDEAIAEYRRAIELRPESAESFGNLGSALKRKGDVRGAIASYRQAITLRPNYPEACNNLGNALLAIGEVDESIATYRQAIRLRPRFAQAHNNLANALRGAGLLDEAVAACRQAVSINPRYADAHSNLILTLHYHPNYGASEILHECRRWDEQHAKPLRHANAPHANSRDPDRRLRIGYVSADLRHHPVGRSIAPVVLHHDRNQFEICIYAHVAAPDALTHRVEKFADMRLNVCGMSDAQLAERIRADRVDILMDLGMHTDQNRLLAFARKPSPVQASWLAFPGTTGMSTIDYRLSDPYLDPVGMDELIYSERTVRLPDTFLCYDPLVDREIRVNRLPALETGIVTFGCLNNFCKVNEPHLKLWAQILRQVDQSRLILQAGRGGHRQRIVDFLARHGVLAGCVEFLEPGRPRPEYLELYHRIDLCLDTFPYNGHTTSLDASWMGVPVVTLAGQTAVSRAGLCLLSNLGLTELAAQTPEQFVQIAVEIARDLPRLSKLRSNLRQRMEQSPLMDAPRFARNLEAAFRQMWVRWCMTAE